LGSVEFHPLPIAVGGGDADLQHRSRMPWRRYRLYLRRHRLGHELRPTDPCNGAFTLSLVVTQLHPTDPCHMKAGTGNLNVTWSDSSTTIGTFAFKARDSKTLSMTGQVTSGTNTRFLTGSALSALVAYPVDPCVGGPTVGTVTLGN
jgi:hypothetical protein